MKVKPDVAVSVSCLDVVAIMQCPLVVCGFTIIITECLFVY